MGQRGGELLTHHLGRVGKRRGHDRLDWQFNSSQVGGRENGTHRQICRRRNNADAGLLRRDQRLNSDRRGQAEQDRCQESTISDHESADAVRGHSGSLWMPWWSFARGHPATVDRLEQARGPLGLLCGQSHGWR